MPRNVRGLGSSVLGLGPLGIRALGLLWDSDEFQRLFQDFWGGKSSFSDAAISLTKQLRVIST